MGTAAAARITLATSRGCDTITAWLAPGTEVVFASIRWAIQRWSSGLMIPSASATTYQDGYSRHAGGPDLNGKRAASAGPWTTARTRASTGSRSWANSLGNWSCGNAKNPFLSTSIDFADSSAGKRPARSAALSSASGANAATYTSVLTFGALWAACV